MRKIKLIVGTHNSQPVGVGEIQLEDAYQSSYRPFLTVLYSHPEIEGLLYYSGTLLEWFEERHPEFLMLLNEMVKRKQVELLGGAYYDPVLPLIPSPDRVGQIELLTTYLRQRFGKRPRGSWVPGGIWEPMLASTIKNCGIDYTFLSDSQFASAGFSGADLYRPCTTEDQGKVLTVYPISSVLSQMVVNENPQRTLDWILSIAERDEEQVVVLLSGGERYGLWERRGKRVFKDGWLDTFFSLVMKNRERVETMLPGRRLREFVPTKKGYFRGTTYEEMMSWVTDSTFLPEGERPRSRGADKSGRVGGGNFRQFLSRYAESNLLYSKIVYTHSLVNQMRGDRHRKKAAREELWRGESHDALWHGTNGGIYDNKLRKAAYRSLIEAEKVTREKGIFKPALISVDFDMDGEQEFLYQGQELNSCVDTVGGTLIGLEYLPDAWNYLDTLGRYRESYHDVDNSFAFDSYPRKAFVDHLFLTNENINSFDRMTYTELGRFITHPYEVDAYERERNEVRLHAEESLAIKSRTYLIKLAKRYTFRKNTVVVHYTITNESPSAVTVCFGSEINLALESNLRDRMAIFTVEKEERKEVGLAKTIVEDASEILIHDLKNEVAITLTATERFRMWSLPVETFSRTLSGMKKCYQSSCLVPQWPLRLESGSPWEVAITLSFSRI